MRIASVTLADFKGQSCSHTIEPLTLLTGPNGAGKSAVLEGIQFALDGSTPAGRTVESAEAYVGPCGGGVSVKFDSGGSFTRELSIDHREHKSSTTLTVDGRVTPKKQAEAALGKRIGSFSPMFDLHAFLDLSDDKRRDFILDLCARAGAAGALPPTDQAAGLLDQIERGYLAAALGEGTVATAGDDWPLLRRQLKQSEQAALETVRTEIITAMRSADILAEAINAAIECAKDCANRARRLKDEGFAGARQLAERRSVLLIVAETVEAMEARLAGMREEAVVIREQIARREGAEQSRNQLANRLAALRELMDHVSVSPAVPRPAYELKDADSVEAEAASLLELVGNSIDAVAAEAEAELAIAETVLNAARERNGQATVALRAAETEVEWVARILKGYEDDEWSQLAAHLKSFGELVTLTGEASDRWILITEFVDFRVADRSELEMRKAQADLILAETQANYDEAGTALNDLSNAYAAAEKKLFQVRFEASAENQRNRLNILRATDLKQHALTIRAAVARAEAEADQITCRQSDLRASIIQAESDLNKLDSEIGGFVPLTQLHAQIEAIGTSGIELKAQLDAKKTCGAITDELARAQAGAEQKAVTWEVAKTMAESARQVREQYMAKLVEPFVGNIDKFLSAGGVPWKAYCRLVDDGGKRIFDLGFERDGFRIGSSMSFGEHNLFDPAVAYALVRLANMPLSLLMLNADGARAKTLHRILKACKTLTGDCSNFIITTPLENFIAPDGWHMIELGNENANV